MSVHDKPLMVLATDDLASKWGFSDGDIPDQVWDALEGIDRLEDVEDRWHEILRKLVRKHLVPLLPAGVDVYDIETNHNPIRTDHWGKNADHTPDIEVYVTMRDILEAAEEAV